jgi:TPR repeat protein
MPTKYDVALKLARRTKNPPRKVYDLLLAADKEGDARATYALATWFLFGNRYCKKDYHQAVRLLKQAAKANIREAAYDLAICFEKGRGARKSFKGAFRCYVQAALLGDVQSHFEVGRMCFHGIGTAKDRDLAEVWLARAEALGVVD